MNLTKQHIIEQFRKLLEEKPYSAITVKDIVERCGINRNTFYYHFQGIPELVESTLEARADEIIRFHGRIETPMDCVEPMIQLITENKQAMFHIYRSLQRDIFLSAMDRIMLHIVTEYVDTVTTGMKLRPDGKLLMIRFYKSFCIGVLLDWLEDGLRYDLAHYLGLLERYFNDANRQALLDFVVEESL